MLAPLWDDAHPLVLDFSDCEFFSADADAVAVLTVLKLGRAQRGIETQIDWSTMTQEVRKQLGRWEVASVSWAGNHRWRDNAIPLLHQRTCNSAALIDFVEKWIVTRNRMPKMTSELAKEVRKSFCELFNNVFLHSESGIGGIAIGQLYPKIKQVQVCVCDAGIGLVKLVQSRGHATASPTDAIVWALQQGNSTSLAAAPHGWGCSFCENSSR